MADENNSSLTRERGSVLKWGLLGLAIVVILVFVAGLIWIKMLDSALYERATARTIEVYRQLLAEHCPSPEQWVAAYEKAGVNLTYAAFDPSIHPLVMGLPADPHFILAESKASLGKFELMIYLDERNCLLG